MDTRASAMTDVALFRRVPAGRVDGHDLEVGVFEQRPGPGSEVLEFGTNRDDDVGVFCDRVRTRVTRDSQGSCVVGVGVGEGGLAGEGLHDGDVALAAKSPSVGAASEYSTPPPEMMRGFLAALMTEAAGRSSGIGLRPSDEVDLRLEEHRRIVVGLGLDVLRESEEGRPTLGGIEHDSEGLRERLQQLFGLDDPVPEASHRLEGVRRGNRRVAELLHLLEHRIDDPMGEGVAADQQQGKTVCTATPAAVTMLVHPGPMEDVATMICLRRLALA